MRGEGRTQAGRTHFYAVHQEYDCMFGKAGLCGGRRWSHPLVAHPRLPLFTPRAASPQGLHSLPRPPLEGVVKIQIRR